MPYSNIIRDLRLVARQNTSLANFKAPRVLQAEFKSEGLKSTATAMYETILPHARDPGIAGITARCLNVDRAIIGLFPSKAINEFDLSILVNPVILSESAEKVTRIERTLTSSAIAWVERPTGIELEVYTLKGTRVMGWVGGEDAWRIHHLVDTINGICFTTRAQRVIVEPTREQIAEYAAKLNDEKDKNLVLRPR